MTLTLRTERVHQDYNPSQTSTTPYTPPKNEEEAKARIQQARTSSTAATSLRIKAADHLNKAVEAHEGRKTCKEEIKKATEEKNAAEEKKAALVDQKETLKDQKAALLERKAKIQAARAKCLQPKNT